MITDDEDQYEIYKQTSSKDDLLDLVKGTGPWQWLIFSVSLFVAIPLSSHNLAISFFAPNLDHWCSRPPGMNISINEWKKLALPPDNAKCFRYDFINISELWKNKRYSNVTEKLTELPCDSWEYDDSVYFSTVLSKWDLVCDREWLVSLSKSIFIAGYFCSVLIFGYSADRWGRKPIIVICNTIALVTSIACAFSTSFFMFATFRFFIAVGVGGAYITMFVLLMEAVGPKYRSVYGLSINFGWCFGFIELPLIAWLLRDWFWIQLVITIPCIVLLSTWWLLPESPRWLLMKGDLEEAKKILIKAAKLNNAPTNDLDRKLKEIMSQKDTESKPSGGNVIDLMRTPGLRQKTWITFYLWAVVSFNYYGLSYNTNELVGDPFINFATSGAIEIPAYLICIFIIQSFGRRNPLSISLIIGAIACLLMYPIPQDPWWLSTIVLLVGKFGITCAFGILYVYTAEIFPTVVRNVGVGSSSVCGRLGSILAPFVRELGHSTHPVVPQIVFGILASVGGLLVLLLPETQNCRVPDTLTEAALITRKQTSTKAEKDLFLSEVNSEKL